MTFRNDETIQCKDCGRPFHWSYRQQREFREKGLEQPKRCPECIERHRAYLRSSERDHPTPALLPQDNPFDSITPPPTPQPVPPPDEKRPSWWEKPTNKMTVLLWFLIIFVIVIIFLLALQIFN